jgi:hypothetical protein
VPRKGHLHQFQAGQPPDRNRPRDPMPPKDRLRLQDHQAPGAAGITAEKVPLREMTITEDPDQLNHHAEDKNRS